MVKDIGQSVAYNPQDALLRRTLAVLEKKGRISREEIYRMLKDCTHRQADDMIQIVLRSGRAIFKGTKVNDAPSFVLIAAKE
jgi:hypothetical protein